MVKWVKIVRIEITIEIQSKKLIWANKFHTATWQFIKFDMQYAWGLSHTTGGGGGNNTEIGTLSFL